jgi:hypothetical protein
MKLTMVHGTMFCKEMSHVNHGNGVALRHERNQDEMWLWSIISDIHGYLFGLDSNTGMEKKLVPLDKYMNCFGWWNATFSSIFLENIDPLTPVQ